MGFQILPPKEHDEWLPLQLVGVLLSVPHLMSLQNDLLVYRHPPLALGHCLGTQGVGSGSGCFDLSVSNHQGDQSYSQILGVSQY